MGQLKKEHTYELLLEQIQNGKYPVDGKLPREIDFARQLGVGKVTLRSALRRLEQEGMIERLTSKGTFVRARQPRGPRRILVVVSENSDISAPWLYMFPTVEIECKALGIEMERCSINFMYVNEPEDTALVIRERFSGIIFLNNYIPSHHHRIMELIRLCNLPVVVAHGSREDWSGTGFGVVTTPYREAWEGGIRHLADQGHRRIATLWMKIFGQVRRRGYGQAQEYEDFLIRSGLAESVPLIRALERNEEGAAQQDFHVINAAEHIAELMSLERPPTAIMCYSDFVALAVCEQLKAMKIRIPEDVAVMGYCGYPGGNLLTPSLSTVDFFYSKSAEMAVRLMARSDEWFRPGVSAPLLFSPFLVIARGSTATRRMENELESIINPEGNVI